MACCSDSHNSNFSHQVAPLSETSYSTEHPALVHLSTWAFAAENLNLSGQTPNDDDDDDDDDDIDLDTLETPLEQQKARVRIVGLETRLAAITAVITNLINCFSSSADDPKLG